MHRFIVAFALVCLAATNDRHAEAQDKLKTSYASVGATNAIWNIAKERGFDKKHGLDVEVVYIGSTTVTVAAILGQDVPIAMAGGNGVANAAVNGADLLSIACFVNTLDFDLVAHPSIQSAAALKGKAIAISRLGSVSDVAARELLKAPGIKAIEEVQLRQIGNAPDRIAAFSQGAVAGFVNSPGSLQLVGKAVPHKVLLTMSDLPKPPAFPWVCASTTKKFLRSNRDIAKRFVTALIEATRYFKTDREGTQKVMAKYHAAANQAYLDDAYRTTAKILERVPFVTREGMRIQLEQARAANPASKLSVDDIVDDSIVREIEKEGFIDRLYR
jgi:ABC-type nitrate/sulfonate/bicarbonate transport system substrate-binding protein